VRFLLSPSLKQCLTRRIRIRGAYQSYINIAFGAGAMLGAAMGGVMADYLGWRWEFGVQIPILVFALLVALITIPDDLGMHGKSKRSVREAMKDFDFMGSFLMATSVTFLILGLVGIFFPSLYPLVLPALSLCRCCR